MYVDSMKLTPNANLRAAAREQLKGNWGISILACVIYGIIVGAAGSFFGIGALIVGGPMGLGLALYFIKLKRQKKVAIEDLFEGFKNFVPSLVLYLLISVFVFLWSLLFVIPGIIAALRYSMAFYILNDNPDLSGMEALNRSKEMMRGQKGKLFALILSFIGWYLLCVLTFGIGTLWLIPYVNASMANFYDDLKSASEQGSSQAAPSDV